MYRNASSLFEGCSSTPIAGTICRMALKLETESHAGPLRLIKSLGMLFEKERTSALCSGISVRQPANVFGPSLKQLSSQMGDTEEPACMAVGFCCCCCCWRRWASLLFGTLAVCSIAVWQWSAGPYIRLLCTCLDFVLLSFGQESILIRLMVVDNYLLTTLCFLCCL
jgi:hypothetical protein